MTRKRWSWCLVGLLATATLLTLTLHGTATDPDAPESRPTPLPPPVTRAASETDGVGLGGMTFEQVLATRRSIRHFKVGEDGKGAALPEAMLGQLLWAAQGITNPERGLRGTPSAGATYPLVAYALTPSGIYRYDPSSHGIVLVREGDHRDALSQLSGRQPWIAQASANIILVADPARIMPRYGQRSMRYVLLEAGHAAQNILLQAVSLGLGCVPIGAHDDAALQKLLKLPEEHLPIYYVSIGELE